MIPSVLLAQVRVMLSPYVGFGVLADKTGVTGLSDEEKTHRLQLKQICLENGFSLTPKMH